MKCENCFCVYWSDRICLLDEIEIGFAGMCESCIYINIDSEALDKIRAEQLKRLEDL